VNWYRWLSSPIVAQRLEIDLDTGKGVFETTPVSLFRNTLGSIPSVVDLDKDGDLDIVSAQFFVRRASSRARTRYEVTPRL
jgi:hypothetical protein